MTIHLVVTEQCDRNCKYCCNRGYDIGEIPHVTEQEMRECKHLFLTGGEPFTYSNPCNLARKYRELYPNIEMIVVYTNVAELYHYLREGGKIHSVDGLNMSIKDRTDYEAFKRLTRDYPHVFTSQFLTKNLLLVMWDGVELDVFRGLGPTMVVRREWQEHFVAADNCLFRRGG